MGTNNRMLIYGGKEGLGARFLKEYKDYVSIIKIVLINIY